MDRATKEMAGVIIGGFVFMLFIALACTAIYRLVTPAEAADQPAIVEVDRVDFYEEVDGVQYNRYLDTGGQVRWYLDNSLDMETTETFASLIDWPDLSDVHRTCVTFGVNPRPFIEYYYEIFENNNQVDEWLSRIYRNSSRLNQIWYNFVVNQINQAEPTDQPVTFFNQDYLLQPGYYYQMYLDPLTNRAFLDWYFISDEYCPNMYPIYRGNDGSPMADAGTVYVCTYDIEADTLTDWFNTGKQAEINLDTMTVKLSDMHSEKYRMVYKDDLTFYSDIISTVYFIDNCRSIVDELTVNG